MNILALDLGSTTGYAYGCNGCNAGVPVIGSITWAAVKELKAQKAQRFDRRGDMRVSRFFEWLTKTFPVDAVVFEDVQFSSSTAQTQLWSSFRTAVWLAFPGKLIEAVPVGTLKKFATGSGSADKREMAVALKVETSLWRPSLDDNAVDAAWLWLWAEKNLSRIKQP